MATSSWNAIVHNAAQALSEAAGVAVREDELVAPPDSKLGDLSFGCFRVAKEQGKNPVEIAQEIAAKLEKGDHSIESASAAGPYVNLTLRTGELVNRVVKEVEREQANYGRVTGTTEKQLMIEYANPNTHKEIHVGHLRNFILGAALSRILDAGGWKVVPVSYLNDMGTNVSRCLWWLVKQNGFEPRTFTLVDAEALLHQVDVSKRNGRYLGNVYTEATQELDAHPELKEDVSFVHVSLENHAPAWVKLWQETSQWCVTELREIFADLGVVVKRQYFESQYIDRSQEIAHDLEKRGIAVKSQGAVIVSLEEEGLPPALIRKSDGTLLYVAKDLALTEQKVKDYPDAERYLVVVDKRQELNFKQLFAILKRIGFQKEFEFVGFEIVRLKDGVMSSRKGNIITWQQFREDVLAYATKETRDRHPDWNEGKVTHTAWCLMMSGIKFGMLKQDSDKIFTFDMEQALAFDGATGPYVQYAATRLASILRKANWEPKTGLTAGDPALLNEPTEKRLALCMAQFPRTVERAAAELRPALLTQWCLEMATKTNEFYRDVKVLEAEPEVRSARLRLIASARSVLLLGLDLLGIPVPEEM